MFGFSLLIYLMQFFQLLVSFFLQDGFESCLPVEIKKIIVETCDTHREPRMKLKSSNAIFHINFNAKSCDYKSVSRRTTDGKPGHIVLEINTWKLSST